MSTSYPRKVGIVSVRSVCFRRTAGVGAYGISPWVNWRVRKEASCFRLRSIRPANADGDWVAFGRARILENHGPGENVIFDLLLDLKEARIEGDPAIQYHTPGNIPVFPLPIWLDQEPTKVLLNKHVYRPRWPVRLMDADAHAGFWSMGWGMLPYSISNRDGALESISVYSVTRRVDGYGETTLAGRPYGLFRKETGAGARPDDPSSYLIEKIHGQQSSRVLEASSSPGR